MLVIAIEQAHQHVGALRLAAADGGEACSARASREIPAGRIASKAAMRLLRLPH